MRTRTAVGAAPKSMTSDNIPATKRFFEILKCRVHPVCSGLKVRLSSGRAFCENRAPSGMLGYNDTARPPSSIAPDDGHVRLRRTNGNIRKRAQDDNDD